MQWTCEVAQYTDEEAGSTGDQLGKKTLTPLHRIYSDCSMSILEYSSERDKLIILTLLSVSVSVFINFTK